MQPLRKTTCYNPKWPLPSVAVPCLREAVVGPAKAKKYHPAKVLAKKNMALWDVYQSLSWLVVYLPLWKIFLFVSWDDFPFPIWWESHNPVMFQTTSFTWNPNLKQTKWLSSWDHCMASPPSHRPSGPATGHLEFLRSACIKRARAYEISLDFMAGERKNWRYTRPGKRLHSYRVWFIYC